MDLQFASGLHQGVCEFPSLISTHKLRRISSCLLAREVGRSSSLQGRIGSAAVVVSCRSSSGSSGGEASGKETEVKKVVSLKIGSPVVITQAPPLLKTAEPMPMMRPNNGLINVGDAGRIMDRRPKDTWAVRFAVGAYLIDRKYFEPLEL